MVVNGMMVVVVVVVVVPNGASLLGAGDCVWVLPDSLGIFIAHLVQRMTGKNSPGIAWNIAWYLLEC